ncbi:hypothetical protein ACCT03_22095 [Rhizobium johnstonii]|uniref:hypothetical protein n=1 Tax=Rhizobium TaxID=379 RepID=UPI00102F67D0|nr:hypothetical protein [Rhizobium leguminosarum]TBF83133.1 hypothetical protein ELG86_13805 [Rhizobium leguminosarum]TBH02617.1 hypothetical protein ELG70_13775 [Rhizobium leguminosarum]TBH12005.1 hypothetical protein ELG68_13075 [Rhizobium leguminosarum]TBH37070.1 hypothetical protein ELG66_15110 [Rhizobium leguminosarum]TBH59241.1 hypothetical protein ELG65_12900 [Rhizobium leguminosarum]
MTNSQASTTSISDFYLRRYQTKGASYCIAVNPFPDECVDDLLIRAACENGFHSWMSHKLLGVPGQSKRATLPGRYVKDLAPEALATLLGNFSGSQGLTPLLETTDSHQKHLLPLFGVLLNRDTLSANRRVSPLALRNAPYLRATWRVWPIAFDPMTKEMLLEDCPVCQQQLSAGFMGNIWCCDRCSELDSFGQLKAVDLREYPQEIVDEVLWDNLDFATSFVDPNARESRKVSRSLLHPDFDDVSDGGVFELMFAIARVLSDQAIKKGRFPISPSVLSAASHVVRAWPERFEMTFGRGTEKFKQIRQTFHPIFYNTRIDARIRRRMKEIVHSSAIRPVVGAVHARKVLRTTIESREFSTFMKWVKRGSAHGSQNAHADAAVIRSLKEVHLIAERVGITVPTLMSLADGDLFPSELLQENARAQIPLHAERLVSRLAAHSSTSRFSAEAVRLPRAVSALYNRLDDPWRRVFNSLLSGELEFWLTNRCGLSTLERIYIVDLQLLLEILTRKEEPVAVLHSIPLSKREAAMSTRLQATGLIRVSRAGLITPPFTRETLMKFRAEFEPSSLLAVRLPFIGRRFVPSSVRDPLRASGIEPVVEYGTNATVWGRADIEKFFQGNLIPCIE